MNSKQRTALWRSDKRMGRHVLRSNPNVEIRHHTDYSNKERLQFSYVLFIDGVKVSEHKHLFFAQDAYVNCP